MHSRSNRPAAGWTVHPWTKPETRTQGVTGICAPVQSDRNWTSARLWRDPHRANRIWWRRGELNPRPKAFRRRPLHA